MLTNALNASRSMHSFTKSGAGIPRFVSAKDRGCRQDVAVLSKPISWREQTRSNESQLVSGLGGPRVWEVADAPPRTCGRATSCSETATTPFHRLVSDGMKGSGFGKFPCLKLPSVSQMCICADEPETAKTEKGGNIRLLATEPLSQFGRNRIGVTV